MSTSSTMGKRGNCRKTAFGPEKSNSLRQRIVVNTANRVIGVLAFRAELTEGQERVLL
jgi:hypothetical protein